MRTYDETTKYFLAEEKNWQFISIRKDQVSKEVKELAVEKGLEILC